jgi:hypothetical protein
VVINAVHPLLEAPTASDRELVAAIGPHLPATLDASDALLRLHEALRDERARAIADRAEAERLEAHVGDEVRFVEVPALEQDVHDLGALSQVAAYLTAERARPQIEGGLR